MKQFNTISLFTGLGCYDIAATWMGWNILHFVEKDLFCKERLKENFPGIPIHSKIETFNAATFRGAVDIIYGGDPCQRNSNANQGKGYDNSESLGGEFIRVVSESMPTIVVRENPSRIRRDAPWPARKFAAALEAIGYVVPEPLKMRACCVGGRIQRERVFVLGYLPKPYRPRLEGNEREKMEGKETWRQYAHIAGPAWRHSSPRVLGKFDRPSGWMDAVKALGNAVPPHQIYEIFKIVKYWDI